MVELADGISLDDRVLRILDENSFIRVEKELFRGREGITLKAYREQYGDTPCAVKVFPADLERDSRQRTQSAIFRAQRVEEGKRKPRNLLEVFEAGNEFEVMEFVEGQNLVEYIAGKISLFYDDDEERSIAIENFRRTLTFDPKVLPLKEKLEIISQVAQGLSHWHSNGVVHGDLQFANLIRRDSDGTIKIVDYGQASSRGESTLGTLLYQPPEKVRHAIDGGSAESRESQDLYSLGSLTYNLFVGHPPYRSDNPDWSQLEDSEIVEQRKILMGRILEGSLIFDHKLPARLEYLIEKSMSHNPNDRPSSRKFSRTIDGLRHRNRRSAITLSLILSSLLSFYFLPTRSEEKTIGNSVLEEKTLQRKIVTSSTVADSSGNETSELFLWSVDSDGKSPDEKLQRITFTEEIESLPVWLGDRVVYSSGGAFFLIRPDGKRKLLGASLFEDDLFYATSGKQRLAAVSSIRFEEGAQPIRVVYESIIDYDGNPQPPPKILDSNIDRDEICYGRYRQPEEYYNSFVFYSKNGSIWATTGWVDKDEFELFPYFKRVDDLEKGIHRFQITEEGKDSSPYIDDDNNLLFIRDGDVFILENGSKKPKKHSISIEDLEAMREKDRTISKDLVPVFEPFISSMSLYRNR